MGGQIYDAIRLSIILEELKPGGTINETALASWFNVSRTPVREACQKLIEDGLVETRSKVGTVVASMDEARVREGIIIRRALEREVVRLLCKSDVDFRPLDKIIALQRVALSHEDHIEFFRVDEELHATLATLAGIPSAWRLSHSVKAHTDRARILLTRHLPNRINTAFDEHLEIIEAIKSRDVELAQALINKHINSALESVGHHV
ncbi:MAG: GntR family transcriptional regulator [Paracoccaceae bacterium]|nr:GntR family transcriptional regulator [Paracoccaceae bacterium]